MTEVAPYRCAICDWQAFLTEPHVVVEGKSTLLRWSWSQPPCEHVEWAVEEINDIYRRHWTEWIESTMENLKS